MHRTYAPWLWQSISIPASSLSEQSWRAFSVALSLTLSLPFLPCRSSSGCMTLRKQAKWISKHSPLSPPFFARHGKSKVLLFICWKQKRFWYQVNCCLIEHTYTYYQAAWFIEPFFQAFEGSTFFFFHSALPPLFSMNVETTLSVGLS